MLNSILNSPDYVPTGKEASTVGLPIHDFVENQGKKKGVAAHTFGDGVTKGGFDLFVSTRPEMKAMTKKVLEQYRDRVGRFYGMYQASLWICLACEHLAAVKPEAKTASKKALAICGSLYEDLGLAGYNPKAEAFDKGLAKLILPEGVLVFREAETDPLVRLRAFKGMDEAKAAAEPGDLFYEQEKGMVVLLRECLGVTADDREARFILWARRANITFADLEAGKEKVRYGTMDFLGKEFKELAVIIGMMRRASKGILASESHLDDIFTSIVDEDGEERKPLCELVDDQMVKYFFGACPVTTGMVFRAKNALKGAVAAVVRERKRQAKREEDGYDV